MHVNTCRMYCMHDFNALKYTYICVLIPVRVLRIHPVGSEANVSHWQLNILFWG